MRPDITMFFLTYNEEDNIIKLIKNAESVLKKVSNKYEILIVNYEGSTDKTEEIVKNFWKKDKRIKLISQPKEKKGVGYAIRLGFENAKYPYIFYSDGDLQFNLEEIRKFLPYIEKYDVIAGYRINRQDPFLRIFTAKVYNILVRILFHTKERDVDCAFRLVNKKIFKKVKLICRLGLGTTELLAKARRYGYKIKEVGVFHYPRKGGQSAFEARYVNIPRINVILDLLKEMAILKKDLDINRIK